ncbi:major facilitator superfamily transporter [Fusarium sporotrichioides]|uniref:Major facilitator superfamily transporter n=1 Tax=Fusarium sporotrichioides TaxID=5514 RepID=A0A395S7Z8_FUSSP|nr:major facilitator superfamily transporter [Fusarium sporotrichioides]
MEESSSTAAMPPQSRATPELSATVANSSIDAQQEPQIKSAMSRNLVVFALGLAILVGILDATIVATLVPSIADDFSSVGSASWYGSAYLLVTGAIQPTFGKLYSTFPSKIVFLSSVALLEVGSLICALAKDSPTFIGGRAVAGLGAAGIISGGLIITALVTPLHQRPIYTGILGSLEGVGIVIGPIIGGQIASSIGWRWCFWINLPIGAVLCAILVFFFHPPKQTPEQKQQQAGKTWLQKLLQLDVEGGLAITGSLTCLLLALEWGGASYPWGDGRIIALLVIFGVSFICVGIHQHWKGEAATFPTRLLKNRTFSMFLICGFCFAGAQFTILYYLPMWFQAVQGVSAAESGTRLLAMVVSVIVVAVFAGGLAAVVGYLPPFVFFATILSSVGAGMLYTLHPGISKAKWIGYQILFGAGSGTGIQQAIVGVQVAVDHADVAYATSSVMLVNTLAGAIFIGVSQTLFLNEMTSVTDMIPGVDQDTLLSGFESIRDTLNAQDLAITIGAYNSGITQAFLIGLVLSSITLLTWPFIRWIPLKKKEDDTGKASEEGDTVTQEESKTIQPETAKAE